MGGICCCCCADKDDTDLGQPLIPDANAPVAAAVVVPSAVVNPLAVVHGQAPAPTASPSRTAQPPKSAFEEDANALAPVPTTDPELAEYAVPLALDAHLAGQAALPAAMPSKSTGLAPSLTDFVGVVKPQSAELPSSPPSRLTEDLNKPSADAAVTTTGASTMTTVEPANVIPLAGSSTDSEASAADNPASAEQVAEDELERPVGWLATAKAIVQVAAAAAADVVDYSLPAAAPAAVDPAATVSPSSSASALPSAPENSAGSANLRPTKKKKKGGRK